MSTPERPGQPVKPPPTPPTPPKPGFRLSWRFGALILALLAINYYVGARAMHSAARLRIPYSPFFLDQVNNGDVVSITSQGTAIQGTFKDATAYAGSKPAR